MFPFLIHYGGLFFGPPCILLFKNLRLARNSRPMLTPPHAHAVYRVAQKSKPLPNDQEIVLNRI